MTVEDERKGLAVLAWAQQKMMKYDISPETITDRIQSPYPSRIKLPITYEVLEADIAAEASIARRATTTFYGERHAKGLSWSS